MCSVSLQVYEGPLVCKLFLINAYCDEDLCVLKPCKGNVSESKHSFKQKFEVILFTGSPLHQRCVETETEARRLFSSKLLTDSR